MRRWGAGIPAVCLGLWLSGGLLWAEQGRALRVSVSTTGELRSWDDRIAGMLRVGALSVRQVREDTLLPGRTHERLTQLHRGVPVFGGELVRQTGPAGATLSVFGTLYEGIDVDATPLLSRSQAENVIARRGLVPYGSEGTPELTVLPLDSGGYALTYRFRAVPQNSPMIRMMFLDARTGEVVLEYSDLKTQSAVGSATGVLSDKKKISASAGAGGFVADDLLRPPAILTYDFKGALSRLLLIDQAAQLLGSDLATDADNTWTDGANVDAHVYAGYTYDYYFKRHGRRGLDNANITIRSVTHPARREDFLKYTNDPDIIFSYYVNAFYAGDGVMVYGEGLPLGFTYQGQTWNYLAGGLDIVAHELTHGVTDYSSRLIYRNESGALNESFSDMMGTSVEFFFQPPGSGPLKADYLLGEDVISGGLRSMQNPIAFGDPDHYSVRFTGTDDNGGVHSNSGISNQAFFLAIEGGRNRVSGLTVQGVGAANREQIEKVFYRAFTQLLPASANFSTARAATIQSARDLYNPGSAAESAVIQAWNAVGVN